MEKTFKKRAESVIVNNISDELGGGAVFKNLKKNSIISFIDDT